MTSRRDLLAMVACPVCRASLTPGGVEVRCDRCGRTYPVANGIPILLHPDSIFACPASAPVASPSPQGPRSPRPGLLQRLVRRGLDYEPPLTIWTDDSL